MHPNNKNKRKPRDKWNTSFDQIAFHRIHSQAESLHSSINQYWNQSCRKQKKHGQISSPVTYSSLISTIYQAADTQWISPRQEPNHRIDQENRIKILRCQDQKNYQGIELTTIPLPLGLGPEARGRRGAAVEEGAVEEIPTASVLELHGIHPRRSDCSSSGGRN